MKRLAITVAIVLPLLVFGLRSSVAEAAGCTVSYGSGSQICYSGQDPYINNNYWDVAIDPDGTQTLTATSAESWDVKADVDGTTSPYVVSYPETILDWDGGAHLDPVSSSNISSAWDTSFNGEAGDFEAAYDIWLDSGSSCTPSTCGPGIGQEVMIWTDNQGESPEGTFTGDTVYDRDITYDVYATSNNSTVTLIPENSGAFPTGSVYLPSVIDWVIDNYGYNGDTEFYNIDYGFELHVLDGTLDMTSVDFTS